MHEFSYAAQSSAEAFSQPCPIHASILIFCNVVQHRNLFTLYLSSSPLVCPAPHPCKIA
jgi:hypothetical protein